jgi:hypothetical protein
VSGPSAVIYFNALSVSAETIIGKTYSYVCTGSSLKMYAKLNFPDNNDIVYEWKKDGSIIGGATAATYTSNQTGAYVVKATKTGCSAGTSQTFNFYSTNYPQTFYNYPDQFQCAGSIVALKADYTSESTVYEWRKDGVIINNPTPASILNITQSGNYSLSTSDANCTQGGNSNSRSFTFSNIIPTNIYTNGKDTLTSCASYSTYLYHNSGSQNSLNYTYQWLKDGSALANETNYNIYVSTDGLYSLKIRQGACSSVSQGVYVKNNGVSSKIITAPYGTQNCTGNSVYLYLVGLNCASYQWQKDGVDITSSSSTSFYATQSGDYRLKISENGIVSYSNVISVLIGNNPTFILRNSTSSTMTTCLPYAYYYLSNVPSGTNFYEWYKNNSLISGANYSSYEMLSAGTYKLKITNGSCVGFSQEVIVNSNSQISKPQLTSTSGKIVCGNTYTTLQSNNNPYVNSEWKYNGQVIPTNPYSFSINISQSGIYTVTALQGSCSTTSDPLVINIGNKQQSIKTFNWNDASTWSCGTVPVVTEDILINKGHTVTIPNNYTGFMKDLQLNGSLQYGTNALLKSRTN